MENIVNVNSPLALLNKEELEFYYLHNESSDLPLDFPTANNLYDLFQQGRSCFEIHLANSHIPPGAIVDARVRFGWDIRKDQYEKRLEATTKAKAMNSTASALEFVSDLLLVVKLKHQDAINKYIATKDPAHLAGIIKVDTVQQLKTLVEIQSILAGSAGATASAPGNTVVYNQQNVQLNQNPGNIPVTVTIEPEAHATFLETKAKEIALNEKEKQLQLEAVKEFKKKNNKFTRVGRE